MLPPRHGLKDIIAANFSASASRYDHFAVMQQIAANSLSRRIRDSIPLLPDGPVLELGCGTGALSRELATIFRDRPLTLVDLAPGMIAQNRLTLSPLLNGSQHVEWRVGDAETIDVRDRYALIASCLTLQWFQNIAGTLQRLNGALVPNGIHLCSFPGESSFPEWRQAATELGLPWTANPLPDANDLFAGIDKADYHVRIWDERIPIAYPTVRDFFRSLKQTGTNTSTSAKHLTGREMASLLSHWQQKAAGPITVTYHISTLMVQRCE